MIIFLVLFLLFALGLAVSGRYGTRLVLSARPSGPGENPGAALGLCCG